MNYYNIILKYKDNNLEEHYHCTGYTNNDPVHVYRRVPKCMVPVKAKQSILPCLIGDMDTITNRINALHQ